MTIGRTVFVGLALVAVTIAGGGGSIASADPPLRTYRVTLTNLTDGQPLSPGVAATHRPSFEIFKVGELAHPGIEAIAEDGNQIPAFEALSGFIDEGVTDVHNIDHPLTPSGTVVGDFTDTLTFEIDARPGDRLSLAVMLICTNDGFTGVSAVKLPSQGSATYLAAGYDAGTEDNTEESADIVDPCSALGPIPLAGDPNGNEDAAVDTSPHDVITHHTGIEGGADLSVSEHGWTGAVAEIVIERVN